MISIRCKLRIHKWKSAVGMDPAASDKEDTVIIIGKYCIRCNKYIIIEINGNQNS